MLSCCIAFAGPPWTFRVSTNDARCELTQGGWPHVVKVLVIIPKTQKGVGEHLAVADLQVSRNEQMVFGARLAIIGGEKDYRMSFSVPRSDLDHVSITLKPDLTGVVRYRLIPADFLREPTSSPNTKNAEQRVDGKPPHAPQPPR